MRPILLLVVAAMLTLPTTLGDESDAECVSLLNAKLYATPAEGEQLQKLEDALAAAEVKYQASPDSAETILDKGKALASLWRYREAVDVYTEGLSKFPEDWRFYRHRGHRFISLRLFENAVKDMTAASQRIDNFETWYHLGLAHFVNGDTESAYGAYRNAYERAQDDDGKVAAAFWTYLSLRKLKRIDEAAALLSNIHESDNVQENRAYHIQLLFFKGERAIDDLTQTMNESPLNHSTIGNGLAYSCLFAGDEEKAKATWRDVVENSPYWPAFGFIVAETELARMGLPTKFKPRV